MNSLLIWILAIVMYSGVVIANDENNAIKVYNSKGEEYSISRESYRKDVLPSMFEKAWNDKEALYSAIVATLQDEFYLDAIEPAKRYQEISNEPESSAVLLGIIYMKLDRLEEARGKLQKYLNDHGDSGVVLTNLAKVIAQEGKKEESLKVLWRSLNVDPNQDNALDWWSAIHYENGGTDARIDAIRKVAEISGSWRPQLWLARNYLEEGEKNKALAIYQSVLSSDAVSYGDVLMMITGDLGNNGYLNELLTLTAPVYNPKKHGIETGVNLVITYKQLKMKKQGLELIKKLETLERYDWSKYLDQLKEEFLVLE